MCWQWRNVRYCNCVYWHVFCKVVSLDSCWIFKCLLANGNVMIVIFVLLPRDLVLGEGCKFIRYLFQCLHLHSVGWIWKIWSACLFCRKGYTKKNHLKVIFVVDEAKSNLKDKNRWRIYCLVFLNFYAINF